MSGQVRTGPWISGSFDRGWGRRRSTALSVSCPCLVPVSVCPDFSGFDSVCCPESGFRPDFRKKNVLCLSVRPDKDETEISGLSVSLSADVWVGLVKPVSMSPAPNPIRIFDKTIPITFSCKILFMVFEIQFLKNLKIFLKNFENYPERSCDRINE